MIEHTPPNMRVAIFSGHKFEKEHFTVAASGRHELVWIEFSLSGSTAIMAKGCEAVCIFVNDDASEKVLTQLKTLGVKILVLRSAGFNHVDLKAAEQLGLRVARVPEYSPHA